MYRTGLFAFVCLVAAATLPAATHAAPKTFKDWSENPKLQKQMELGRWGYHVKKLKGADIEKPKKVGLLSHMIWDIGEHKFSAMAYSYGGTYMRSSGLSESGGNHFATSFAENSLDTMKAAFASHGMELLLPDEFAATDEQKQAYLSFDLPLGGLSKVTAKIVDRFRHNPEMTASAVGFQAIPAHLFAMDKKARTALEELRTTMGLDAIAVLCVETRSTPKTVGVAKIDFMMWGPNPDPMPKQKIARAGWASLIPYASGKFGKSFKGAFVADMKKSKIVSEDYAGFGGVVGALVEATLGRFEEEFEGK